jgi:hypothetical protein
MYPVLSPTQHFWWPHYFSFSFFFLAQPDGVGRAANQNFEDDYEPNCFTLRFSTSSHTTAMTKSAIVATFVVLVAFSVVVQAGPICRYPVNGYLYDITPLQAYPQVIAPVEHLQPDHCGDLPPLRAHCGTSSSSCPVSTGEM